MYHYFQYDTCTTTASKFDPPRNTRFEGIMPRRPPVDRLDVMYGMLVFAPCVIVPCTFLICHATDTWEPGNRDHSPSHSHTHACTYLCIGISRVIGTGTLPWHRFRFRRRGTHFFPPWRQMFHTMLFVNNFIKLHIT